MAQISLKRALKLRKTLEAYLASYKLNTTANVSLLLDNQTPFIDVIEPASSKLDDSINEYITLSAILAALRFDIAKANQTSVEWLLAMQAAVDRDISLFKTIAAQEATPTVDEFMAEIAYAKKSLETKVDAYSRYDRPEKSITVSIISQEQKQNALESVAALRRRREELEDQRTAINSTTQIQIVDESYQLLRKLGIL